MSENADDRAGAGRNDEDPNAQPTNDDPTTEVDDPTEADQRTESD